MRVPPHFLLFSESRCQQGGRCRDQAESVGHWRFVLESVDGANRLEAADEELDADPGRLELLAVVRGLEALDQPSRVTLVTPSRYVTRGLRFGLEQWRENGWQWERFGEMARVKNWDLWQRIDRAMRFHQVECRTWRFDLPEEEPSRPHFPMPAAARGESHRDCRTASSKPDTDLPSLRLLSACRRTLSAILSRWWPIRAEPLELRAA